jgi:predicted MFS family arabinose efflux permease
MLGSISSGLSTHFFNWRPSFVVIAIFCFIITLLAFWAMLSTPRSGNVRMVVKQFDYLGTALTIVGLALFSTALT